MNNKAETNEEQYFHHIISLHSHSIRFIYF